MWREEVTELHGQWSVRLPCDTGVQEGGTWKQGVGSVVGGTFEYPASFPGAQMCIQVPVTSGECSDLFFMCMVFPMGTS